MIFIVLLVIVFGMVISTMQFGSMPDGGSVTAATPRAQVYAVNMETWHQAAMLAAQSAAFTPVNCVPANQLPCVDALNPVFWNGTNGVAINGQALAQNWPEYQPVVAEGDPTKVNSGGWQSFLIKNINGTNAAQVPGTENYVLTVFRGYGYGGNYTNSNISSNTGNMSNAQIATALAKTVQDRMGVGNLQCTATVCSFTRAAAYTPPGGATSTSDLPLQFPLGPFISLQTGNSPALPTNAIQPVENLFQGLPAIMTRVGGGSAPQTCPTQYLAWNNFTFSWPDNNPMPDTANGYNCYAQFGLSTVSATPVTANGVGTNGYTASNPTATCGATGWSAPSNLNCSNSPTNPNQCPGGSVTWSSPQQSGNITYCSGPVTAAQFNLNPPVTEQVTDSNGYGTATATCILNGTSYKWVASGTCQCVGTNNIGCIRSTNGTN